MQKKNQSQEDYMEAILMVRQMKGSCRSIDVARHLGFSKPSVSIAVNKLIDEGFVTKEEHGELMLTDKGMDAASQVLERHNFLCSFLEKIGVDPKTANEDACRLEHVFSEESFDKFKAYVEQH